jgi:hypothetical protein
VNTIDGIVRKIETELGIQDREIRITKSPAREWCTCDDDSDIDSEKAATVIIHPDKKKIESESKKKKIESESDNTAEVRINKIFMKETERKFMDMGFDSNDVFAMNPSSLMLAKIKVVRKFDRIEIPMTPPELAPEPAPEPEPLPDRCAK